MDEEQQQNEENNSATETDASVSVDAHRILSKLIDDLVTDGALIVTPVTPAHLLDRVAQGLSTETDAQSIAVLSITLEARITELEEALGFYADQINWYPDGVGCGVISFRTAIDCDAGERARTALEPKDVSDV